jgi:hypothetical protein
MKKSAFVSLFLNLVCLAACGQMRYAGWLIHERDQSVPPGPIGYFFVTMKVITPKGQIMPDSFSVMAKEAWAHKDKVTELVDGNVLTIYRHRQAVGLQGGIYYNPDFRLRSMISFRNSAFNDTLYCGYVNIFSQPDHYGHTMDTAYPVNTSYPLIIGKGKSLRFNAVNMHPETSFTDAEMADEFPFNAGLSIESDPNTSEYIFIPTDTGHYILFSGNTLYAGGPNYDAKSFYSVYVSSDSANIPSGYFSYADKSYADTFLSISAAYPDGSLTLEYNSHNADSVRFDILPVEKPYKGLMLDFVQSTKEQYSLSVAWNKEAFIHHIVEGSVKYINLLATKYRDGKDYYETFTISFKSLIDGIQNHGSLREIKVFPNPAADDLHISVPSLQHYTCLMTDISGRQVMQRSVCNTPSLSLDISSLKPGIYLLSLISVDSKERYYEKICIR